MEQPPQYNRPVPPLTFDQAVKRVLNNYAGFTGRASRAEFWWFILFTCIVSWVIAILYAVTNMAIFQWISWVVNLGLLIPTLAVSWRRLHDVGRAGGWWFINFVPIVGWIFFIIWCVKPSEPQPNRFGNVPVN